MPFRRPENYILTFLAMVAAFVLLVLLIAAPWLDTDEVLKRNKTPPAS
jgi:quinol-cytochrome oxidoreductase complex cytochrome b subunit